MYPSGQNKGKSALSVLLAASLFLIGIPGAHAANYTVTYDANSNQHQAGTVTGSVPNPGPLAQGTISLATNGGNLARQGFTFGGWNTLATGLGTTYAAGASYNLVANVTLYAKWEIPQSARLIGSSGSIVTVSNPNSVANASVCMSTASTRGITSDGTNVFFRSSTSAGYICKVSPTGVLISANNVGTSLANLAAESLDLTYSSGCIFVRYDGIAREALYCIDTSDWTMTSRALPAGKGLLAGGGWLDGNLIDFPDGRIGAVSAPNKTLTTGVGAGQCPSGMYCKVLRLYTPANTGKNVSFTFSEDIVLADQESGWPDDEHGIATDGTYLYEIKYSEGYKVYALQSGAPSYIVFDGSKADTCGATNGTSQTLCSINNPLAGATGTLTNATYLGRIHGTNQYLMGDHDAARFYVSGSVIPPAGPGSADSTPPTFSNSSSFTTPELSASTTNVATIRVSESSTITISGGVDNSLFNVVYGDSTTAYIRFNSSPNFESPADSGGNNIYDITVRAADALLNAATQAISISVTDVNEAPSIAINGSGATHSITQAENIGAIANYSATDVDTGSVLSWSLSGTDSSTMAIGSATGILTFNSAPDFEGPLDSDRNNTYIVIIAVSDGSLSDTQTLTITITNATESAALAAPTISGTAYKGISITLTLTSNAAGKVRFFMDGKRIATCLSRPTSGSYPNFTATCSWKPTVTMRHLVTASITPTDTNFNASTSSALVIWVQKRTTARS
jgi:uncharacterized repeat protein (TIGR02543 family)